jgi:hypothetical protein
MRDLVTKRSYRFRKMLDDFLFKLMPNTWVPLYNSVSFSHMPYKKCIENRAWQDRVLNRALIVGGITLSLGLIISGYKVIKHPNFSGTFVTQILNNFYEKYVTNLQ